jgi:arylsulfate sulfotransferase
MTAHSKCVVTLLLACGVVSLSGCASSSSGNSIVQISPTTALLVPGQEFQFNAVTGVPNPPAFAWQVNGVVGGSATTGTITTNGAYTAPAKALSQPVQISIRSQAAQATVSMFDPTQPNQGSVAATQNPLVASYTIPIPDGGSAQVQFGTNTTYGLSTSVVSAPAGGETGKILVAGMLPSTAYHMQATVNFAGGTVYKDADHIFTTGPLPANAMPNLTTQILGSGTQADGIELLSLTGSANGVTLCALATDLSGNVIWYYPLPNGAYVEPVKLLPNGHMLIITEGTVNDMREIDLAGNIVTQITINDIDTSLSGQVPWGIAGLNHDALLLPNGHYILLANIVQPAQDAVGVPDGTPITGNALLDWAPNQGVVWTWSTFDHLSMSRAPFGMPDWTHGNALAYSPDDGNLLFSMRNQNWIVKINYQDGNGDGSMLWRFGPGGDFTLPNGEAPIDWNYGQHFVTIQSPNSTGVFSMMFFDNGNNRMMDSNNDVCGTGNVGPCYSSVPIFQVNEYNKTASVMWQQSLLPAYSICCGDALVLPNGNVEYDVAYDVNTPNVSYIEEITQTNAPELLWKMSVTGQVAYRGYRISSLYPDITWPAYSQANVRHATATNATRTQPRPAPTETRPLP